MFLNKVEICGVNTSELPLLSNEEKENLFLRIERGDKAAREKYVKGNLRLVLSVIQRFSNNHEHADDLFQVGCIGLMKAVDNFDRSLDVKFSTYAVPMILGEVRRYLRDNNSIRVSRSLRDTAYKAIYAKEQLTKSMNRTPTIEEIAKETDISEESPEALMTVDSADVEYGTNRMTEAVADHVVPIVGIVFGLPCAAIVCIVWFLTNYFIRRNRDKNALISKAIDNDYTLPDAFFSQPASSEAAIGDESQMSAANSTKMFAAQPLSQRDPRRFSTGIMLVCIGVPVFIFFLVNGVTPAAFLCGGILIFIGVAKLLSYYFVPGYSNERLRRPGTQRPTYQPQALFGQSQPFQQPYQRPYGYQPQQGYGAPQSNPTATPSGMSEYQQCPPPVPPKES